MEHHEISYWTGNIVSAAAVVTSLLGFVPAVAGVVALVWYVIQIYESETMRRWLANRRHKKIAHLKARILLLEAANQLEPLLPPDDE